MSLNCDSGWQERPTKDDIYDEILNQNRRISKGKTHRELKFHLSVDETLELLKNAKISDRNLKTVQKVYRKTMRNKDNKSYQEQRDIRERFQPTNGLVFKNIPFCFSRQECYDAILGLVDKFRSSDGTVHFQGRLNMMQFMFPKKTDDSQTAFPIFTCAADRNMLWVAAKENYRILKGFDVFNDKKGLLFLTHPKSGKDYEVSVELVRNSIGEPQYDIENIRHHLQNNRTDLASNQPLGHPPRINCPMPSYQSPDFCNNEANIQKYQKQPTWNQTSSVPVPQVLNQNYGNIQPPPANLDDGSFMRQLLLDSHDSSANSFVQRPPSEILFCSYDSLSTASGYSMSSATSTNSISSVNNIGPNAAPSGIFSSYHDLHDEQDSHAISDFDGFCFNRQESTQTVVPRNFQKQDSVVSMKKVDCEK